MRITPTKSYYQKSVPNFKAHLYLDKSAVDAVGHNEQDKFNKAAERFDEWLKKDAKTVDETISIRKNSAKRPRHFQILKTFDAHNKDDATENLEFELMGQKCGFYYNSSRSEDELLDDFKNMFFYLLLNK